MIKPRSEEGHWPAQQVRADSIRDKLNEFNLRVHCIPQPGDKVHIVMDFTDAEYLVQILLKGDI